MSSAEPTLEQTPTILSEERLKASDLDFYALLRRQGGEGRLFFNQQRAVIFNVEAIGTLREQLIETVGHSLAQDILKQFGYTQGYKDADKLSQINWESEADWLMAGFSLRTLEGIAYVKTQKMEFNHETGQFYLQGYWRNSFEAEDYLHRFGTGEHPVCWMLTAYASGYASRFFGCDLLTVETSCVGKGDDCCRFEIRPLAEWGNRAKLQPAEASLPLPAQAPKREQLLAEAEEQARRLTRLNEMSQELSKAETEEQVFQIAVQYVSDVFDGSRGSIALLDSTGEWLSVLALQGNRVIPLGADIPVEGTMVGVAVRENRLLIAPDFQSGGWLKYFDAQKLSEQGLASCMNVPLVVGGNVIGVLNVGSNTANAYNERSENLIAQMAAMVSSALENKRLLKQFRVRARREQILRKVTAQVRRSADVDTVMRTAAKEVGRALGRSAFVYLNHQEKNESDQRGTEEDA